MLRPGWGVCQNAVLSFCMRATERWAMRRARDRVEVFGSAANGAFDPAHSDMDFLVEFSQDDAGSLFHRYFGLLETLERLFGRKIDLVSASALSNPYFIAAVNQSRQSVYASARAQTA